MIGYTLAAATLIAMSSGTIHAEKIHWENFYTEFGGRCATGPGISCGDGAINDRNINVVTRDGRKHHAGTLCIALDKVRLDCGGRSSALARGDIARIEVRNTGRFVWHTVAIAEIPLIAAFDACGVDVVSGGGPCNRFKFVAKLTLLAPIWAYCAASAPVTLSMDAVSRIIPPRKFEIVP